MDVRQVLEEFEAALDANPRPDTDALQEMLGTLDNAAFIPALKEYLRSRNDPDAKAEVLNRLSDIMRKCSRRSAVLKNDVINLQIGGSTGGAAVVASIIAIASTTIPGFFIVPLFAGSWVAWTCLRRTPELSEEAQIYADMSERVRRTLEKTDEQ